MSVVVERGLARCPRCVAVADYTFVESGPNSVRYEVHCRKCGEDYCEVNTPVAPDFTAAVRALALNEPIGPLVRVSRRTRVLGRLAQARDRGAAALASLTARDWRTLLRRRRSESSTPATHP